MDDMIQVPRAVLEALVDPTAYIDSDMGYCSYCNHCGRPFLGFPASTPDLKEHAESCPVRLAQELLEKKDTVMFTADESDYLAGMVCNWIDEGFTTPPYDLEVYRIIQKLGIRKADCQQYDITPPPAIQEQLKAVGKNT